MFGYSGWIWVYRIVFIWSVCSELWTSLLIKTWQSFLWIFYSLSSHHCTKSGPSFGTNCFIRNGSGREKGEKSEAIQSKGMPRHFFPHPHLNSAPKKEVAHCINKCERLPARECWITVLKALVVFAEGIESTNRGVNTERLTQTSCGY